MRRSFQLIAVLLITLVVTAGSADAWHQDHGLDNDCAVCKLRHQPLEFDDGRDAATGPALAETASREAADVSALVSADRRLHHGRAPPTCFVV